MTKHTGIQVRLQWFFSGLDLLHRERVFRSSIFSYLLNKAHYYEGLFYFIFLKSTRLPPKLRNKYSGETKGGGGAQIGQLKSFLTCHKDTSIRDCKIYAL